MSRRAPEDSPPPEDIDSDKSLEKQRIVIVDASQAIGDTARDVADASLTADKAELQGVKGLVKRIWKHNLAEEYYRQTEIARVRGALEQAEHEGALDESALDAEARRAIWERFQHEYDETIHHEAGETREAMGDTSLEKEVQKDIQTLVERYAVGGLNEDAFQEEKIRLFSKLHGARPDVINNGDLYADNLFEIAQQNREAIEAGQRLEELDLDFEVVLGRATPGVRTEAKFGQVDKMVEHLQKTKVGRWVNETTLAVGLSMISIVGRTVSRSVMRSRALAIASLGGTTAVSAGLAGARESKRFAEERRQHSREAAQGKETLTGERRLEMETFRYRTADARELADTLEQSVYERNADGDLIARTLSPAEVSDTLASLVDIESRVALSDREQLDLISYTDGNVEQERLRLDILRAQAKVDLRDQLILPSGMGPDEYFETLRDTAAQELRTDTEGVEDLDRLFIKAKHKRVAKAAAIGALTGLTIGATAQEAYAVLSDSHSGLIEGSTSDQPGGRLTALEQLRQLVTGDHAETTLQPGQSVEMPYGVEVLKRHDGNFSLTKHGEVVDERALLNRHGVLPEPNQQLLAEHGVDATQITTNITDHQVVERSPEEYIRHNPDGTTKVERVLWYDNDTSGIYDQNELRLYHGGIDGTGLDSHGNYTYTVSSMTPDGSFHDGLSADAAQQAQQGKLRLNLSLSENTQDRVFSIPIDQNGNAVIDKHSEAGQLLFDRVDGKAEFLGKYNEVAQVVGQEHGAEQVRMLATEVGPGQHTVEDVVNTSRTVPTVHLASGVIEDRPPYDFPPVIPLRARRPLERTKALPESTPGYLGYYGEGEYGLLDRARYRERFAREIIENSDLSISEHEARLVADYLDRLDPEYRATLDRLVESAPTMRGDTTAVIAIPAYREGENIEKTLEAYAAMTGTKPFEIVILENHPDSLDRDDTEEAINRFKNAHPEMSIAHLHQTFEEKPTIGLVRKILNDSVLLRKQQAGIDRPFTIISSDADVESVSPKFVDEMVETFENDSKVDAVGGRWDFPMEAYEAHPLFYASQRLWQLYDLQMMAREKDRSPNLIGRCSAFQSGIYAAVGGYNPAAELAEDMELGWLIKNARREDPSRVKYQGKAHVVSNPRRALSHVRAGGMLVEQYGDFHTNEEVRELSVDELLAERGGFDEEDFQNQVQALYDFYSRWKTSYSGGWMPDDRVDDIFRRSMNGLGVQFRMDGGRVVITDADKLRERMSRVLKARSTKK
ncbi:glycosyltransferase family 2 protein [Patescibacteria group bacterium]|nr:glycosyltransferase family 2 protein [Patescibacteria group bacterium]